MNAEIKTEIRTQTDVRYFIQKFRIKFSNKLSAKERETDNATPEENALLQMWLDEFEGLEEKANKRLVAVMKQADMPIYHALVSLKGIGDITAAKLLAEIDITRCDTISALWRYAGYGVIEGKREKPVKGEKLHYNQRLKIAVRLTVESFIKSRSPYAAIYASEKEKWMNRPDMTKMHAHNAAIGKCAKVFLSHLWLVWRQMEGLPLRDPYAIGQMGHTHLMSPAEFGWEVAEVAVGAE